MKNLSLLALLILPCAVEAQTSPKLIALSSTSTVAVADIRKGFHKKCPNVSITFKPLKADYALEAVADKFSNAINKCVHGNQQTALHKNSWRPAF
jgi:hypothetical protein